MTSKTDSGAKKIWETTLGQLQLQVPRSSYDTWLKGTVGLTLEDGQLTVGAASPFAAEWLERRMHQLIHRTVGEVVDPNIQVRYQVVSTAVQAVPPLPTAAITSLPQSESDDPQPAPVTSRVNGVHNSRYTFQNFVIGRSNQLAYAASLAVAESPGDRYNPLFIYSDVGLGKTHLLHAIAAGAAQRGLHALYVSTEHFTNDFIRAIRERKTEQFRDRYRSADILLLDDIQFLAGKEQTQEGFFHTFNDLHNAGRQIVIACDTPPRDVTGLESRLQSRFEWGLIADIQPPDLETRQAILLEKAAAQGVTLSDSVALEFAQRACHSIRELEGCLNRMLALAQFLGEDISDKLVHMALADIPEQPAQPMNNSGQVIDRVAAAYNISASELTTRSRDKRTTLPQRVAMYILAELLQRSMDTVASSMGGWTKKTVGNAIKDIVARRAQDSLFSQELQSLCATIQPPTPRQAA
jgi:chromosomal replication initiator protein